jgi:hypothetical protein
VQKLGVWRTVRLADDASPDIAGMASTPAYEEVSSFNQVDDSEQQWCQVHPPNLEQHWPEGQHKRFDAPYEPPRAAVPRH